MGLIEFLNEKIQSIILAVLGLSGFVLLITVEGYLSVIKGINYSETEYMFYVRAGYMFFPFILLVGLVHLEQHISVKRNASCHG